MLVLVALQQGKGGGEEKREERGEEIYLLIHNLTTGRRNLWLCWLVSWAVYAGPA